VTKGFPVGQQYGLGDHWLKFNRPYVCGAGSPCTTTTSDEAFKYFPVGPPYIAHRADLEAITVIWADFVPRIYEEYPHLLAESEKGAGKGWSVLRQAPPPPPPLPLGCVPSSFLYAPRPCACARVRVPVCPCIACPVYGYCMAAAHLGLKHGRLDHMMVSNTLGGGEGWPLVDALGDDRLCRPWTSEPGDVTGEVLAAARPPLAHETPHSAAFATAFVTAS